MPSLVTDLTLLRPELFLGLSALFLVLLGACRGDRAFGWVSGLAILALVLTAGEIASNGALWTRATAFGGGWVTDSLAAWLKILCLTGLAAAMAMSGASLRADRIGRFEYPILILLSGLGMMLMVSANDFLTLYMGLELSSLALYVLAAFRRETLPSAEAGMKYFILGALSSGMLLFGVSLVYGFAGSTQYDTIAHLMTGGVGPAYAGLVVGMAFILAGMAFKISAVPFHMWTPDVYQGAPMPVTALFAMVPKIAALGISIRILFVPFAPIMNDWVQIVTFLALASMMWGAFAALLQSNVKRLLAYSSIGNMGYAMLGLLVGTPQGIAATLFYMSIYLAMTAGTFAVLLALRAHDRGADQVDDLAGLSRRHPVLAYALAIFMFAMSGLPPLAGFLGKLMVFQVVVAKGFYAIAIVGVVTSVVAAYYYLRLIRVMFFDAPRGEVTVTTDATQRIVIAVSVLIIVALIFVPNDLYALCLQAAQAMTLAHH